MRLKSYNIANAQRKEENPTNKGDGGVESS